MPAVIDKHQNAAYSDLNMNPIEPKEIDEIPYPKEIKNQLKKIKPILLNYFKNNTPETAIESGIIPLGFIDKKLRLNLFILNWIICANEIIDNLNLTISDLRNLSKNYLLIPGSPSKRYHLLVRVFFYEFYRFKEILHISLKAFQKLGYLNKKVVKNINDIFYKRFNAFIDVRNSFVHDDILWKGKKHFDLMWMSYWYEEGYSLKDKNTGKIITISEVLNSICDHMANIFKQEGNSMSQILQIVTKTYVKIVFKKRKTVKSSIKSSRINKMPVS